jgi:four helix bundle protein
MQMTAEVLKKRTFDFALNTLRQIDGLPASQGNQIMGRQVMRSSTSIGANYRSACKAKSSPDFINKLKIVEEESDETVYWLELISAYNNINTPSYSSLLQEAKELEKIFAASVVTAKQNRNRKL